MLDLLGIPDLWSQIVDYFTSPFWFYLFWGGVISFCAIALAWFFSGLRPLSGAVVISIVLGLIGYRRGEKDAEQRQARRQPPKEERWRPW